MGRGGKKLGLSKTSSSGALDLLRDTGLQNEKEVREALEHLLENRPATVERVERIPGVEPLPGGAPKVVGIFGQAQSGKDAAVDYLEEKYQGIYRMAFSDTVIDEANQILLKENIVISQENKALMPVRRFLQALGLARVRQDSMHWGSGVQKKIARAQADGYQMIVVTGVRTEADCELLRSLGAPLWKVHRPGNTYKAEHSIESEIDNLVFDKELINNKEGDLSPLFAAAEEALGPI